MIDNHKAAVQLLNDKDAFRVMVEVAEDEHAKGVSFNVVIGRALRALVQAPTQKESSE